MALAIPIIAALSSFANQGMQNISNSMIPHYGSAYSGGTGGMLPQGGQQPQQNFNFSPQVTAPGTNQMGTDPFTMALMSALRGGMGMPSAGMSPGPMGGNI